MLIMYDYIYYLYMMIRRHVTFLVSNNIGDNKNFRIGYNLKWYEKQYSIILNILFLDKFYIQLIFTTFGINKTI